MTLRHRLAVILDALRRWVEPAPATAAAAGSADVQEVWGASRRAPSGGWHEVREGEFLAVEPGIPLDPSALARVREVS